MRVNAGYIAGLTLGADKVAFGDGIAHVPELACEMSRAPGAAVRHPHLDHVSPRLVPGGGMAVPYLGHNNSTRRRGKSLMITVHRVNAPVGRAIGVSRIPGSHGNGWHIRNTLFVCQNMHLLYS